MSFFCCGGDGSGTTTEPLVDPSAIAYTGAYMVYALHPRPEWDKAWCFLALLQLFFTPCLPEPSALQQREETTRTRGGGYSESTIVEV